MIGSSIFFFIVAISVLVSVHEFGHFWVARKCGVKVLRFSVGFGKPLWTWRSKKDDTEYVIAMLPLGGYVKMLDENEGPVPEAELDQTFNRKSLGQRFLIVAAGPAFNFFLAILLYWLIFMVGVTGMIPKVGEVSADSLAAKGGFMAGDTIVSIAGSSTSTWNDAFLLLINHSFDHQPVAVDVIDEDNRSVSRRLDFTHVDGNEASGNIIDYLGLSPLRPQLPAVIGELQSGGAAEMSGLQKGDLILSADDVDIEQWLDWVNIIRSHPNQVLNIRYQRDQQVKTLDIRPKSIDSDQGPIGKIGAGVLVPENFLADYQVTVHYSVLASLTKSLQKTGDITVMTGKFLARMVTGDIAASNLGGPVSIAQYAGSSASAGLVAYLGFLALISISLGVLNLLPVPMLDGGHLLYYLIEWIKGSPVSDEIQMLGQRIGVAILLGVMVLAFYNDFVRVLS